jgi:AcrR family transcriptional regulator
MPRAVGGADDPQSSRDRKRPHRPAALLDAAVSEFASKGYEAATVAGIAARAGVTTGAVYGHFHSKLEPCSKRWALHRRDTHAAELRDRRQAGVGDGASARARLVGPPSGRRDLL